MRLAWLGVVAIWPLVLSIPPSSQQPSGSWQDPSPHRVQFVTVDRDVRLEILDWGGSGMPLVLLAGGETRRTYLMDLRRSSHSITTYTASRGADSGRLVLARPGTWLIVSATM